MSKPEKTDEKILGVTELLTLYTLFMNMHRDISVEIRTYTGMFLSSNLVVLGGSIVIYTNMNEDLFKFISLAMCGFLLIFLSKAFMEITSRAYRNALERVAQSGQIENLLDLNNKDIYKGKKYFNDEGLLMPRHFNDMSNFKSKEMYVDAYKNKGQNILIKSISTIFTIYGFILVFLFIFYFYQHIFLPCLFQ